MNSFLTICNNLKTNFTFTFSKELFGNIKITEYIVFYNLQPFTFQLHYKIYVFPEVSWIKIVSIMTDNCVFMTCTIKKNETLFQGNYCVITHIRET